MVGFLLYAGTEAEGPADRVGEGDPAAAGAGRRARGVKQQPELVDVDGREHGQAVPGGVRVRGRFLHAGERIQCLRHGLDEPF